MKTVLIGGGKGARAIMEMVSAGLLRRFAIHIELVADPQPDAPGMVHARSLGIATTTDFEEAVRLPGLELIIELTGRVPVLNELYRLIPVGVRIVDHTFAQLFWDLFHIQRRQKWQLREITNLEKKVESERRFLQSMFDAMSDMMVVYDRNGRVVRANRAYMKFANRQGQDVSGMACETLFEGTELQAGCRDFAHMLEKVIKTGSSNSHIWQISEPVETYWSLTFTPIMTAEGHAEAVVATWHRLTERVMLHREIESMEERFRSFIDSAQDWITIKGQDGRYMIVNPACSRAFGLEPKHFWKKRPEDIFSPSVAQTILKHDADVLSEKRQKTFEEIIPLDGVNHHFHTVRFPLNDYKGNAIGVCTIARDITGERALHDQLVQSTKLAALGNLAAGVAHEINNPLTGILAYAEDMLEELDEGEAPEIEDIKVIIRETMRCREIVRNLLDFARQEKLKLECVSPNLIVEQTLSLVRKLPQFRNITIETRLQDPIPLVQCDMHQLQQVVLNLMVNAADAMGGSGHIILRTEYERERNRCAIDVQDNGPGIPENLIDKIFEPFFSTKGTNGLGLAVSWGIVERHHGVIEVDIPEDFGSIFRILLPAQKAHQPHE